MTPIRPAAALLPTLLLACLAGCVGSPKGAEVGRGDFAAELFDLRGAEGPPKGPAEACWQSDIRPAVIETVTEQVMVKPESVAADGKVTPAVFATQTHQQIVQDRGTVWFRSPCPAEMTPEFIATLQRALKARGLYLLPLTGSLDSPTQAAIRRYQSPRGLDSDRLSLAAARALGLVATSRDDL